MSSGNGNGGGIGIGGVIIGVFVALCLFAFIG